MNEDKHILYRRIQELEDELEEVRAHSRVKMREWLNEIKKKDIEVSAHQITIQMLKHRIKNLQAQLNGDLGKVTVWTDQETIRKLEDV